MEFDEYGSLNQMLKDTSVSNPCLGCYNSCKGCYFKDQKQTSDYVARRRRSSCEES